MSQSAKIKYCKFPDSRGNLTETSSCPIDFRLILWYCEIEKVGKTIYQHKDVFSKIIFPNGEKDFQKNSKKILKISGENIYEVFCQ